MQSVLGKLPPSPNSNANAKPNPDPDRGPIFRTPMQSQYSFMQSTEDK